MRALGKPRPKRGISDPACGGGDLLLAWSKHAPVLRSLPRTLERWGKYVSGSDTQSLFIRATRARMILAAVAKGATRDHTRVGLDEWFPYLRLGNGLASEIASCVPSDIVLNPPFTKMDSPVGCSWGRGKVSAAAVFVDHCIATSPPGTRITAILPDVLRSGARYARWRSYVSRATEIINLDVVGRFDPQVEVDVFILRLTVCEQGRRQHTAAATWCEHTTNAESIRIGDRFHVSVGPVVPHRDPETGPERPYLHARNALANGVVAEIDELRQFAGRVYTPPFVVVRRTSSPSDIRRPVATMITEGAPTAVENHLIVLEPQDGRIETCAEGMRVLSTSRTREWLDEEIRCRHLTVGAVASIPWIGSA